MQTFLKSAGQNAVDGIGNVISQTGRRCIELFRTIVGLGVTISSTTMGTISRIRATPSVLTTHNIISRGTVRFNRTGMIISVVPAAICISLYMYWWTRKRK